MDSSLPSNSRKRSPRNSRRVTGCVRDTAAHGGSITACCETAHLPHFGVDVCECFGRTCSCCGALSGALLEATCCPVVPPVVLRFAAQRASGQFLISVAAPRPKQSVTLTAPEPREGRGTTGNRALPHVSSWRPANRMTGVEALGSFFRRGSTAANLAGAGLLPEAAKRQGRRVRANATHARQAAGRRSNCWSCLSRLDKLVGREIGLSALLWKRCSGHSGQADAWFVGCRLAPRRMAC